MFPVRIPGGLPGPSSRSPTTPVDNPSAFSASTSSNNNGNGTGPTNTTVATSASINNVATGTSGTAAAAPSASSIGTGKEKPPVKVQVKPFTKESLDKHESKTVQLVRDYGFQPRRKLSVEDGSVLPNKFEPFPTRLYGKPLEEIDNFIYDEVSSSY